MSYKACCEGLVCPMLILNSGKQSHYNFRFTLFMLMTMLHNSRVQKGWRCADTTRNATQHRRTQRDEMKTPSTQYETPCLHKNATGAYRDETHKFYHGVLYFEMSYCFTADK